MGPTLGNRQSWDLRSDSINWRVGSAASSNMILGKTPLGLPGRVANSLNVRECRKRIIITVIVHILAEPQKADKSPSSKEESAHTHTPTPHLSLGPQLNTKGIHFKFLTRIATFILEKHTLHNNPKDYFHWKNIDLIF